MSKDSPEFFPPSGSFQSVVPLSEIDETPGAVEIEPRAATPPAPPAKRTADAVPARPAATRRSGTGTTADEEEETLVSTRRRVSTRTIVPRAGRRKSRLPSWPLIVTCLAAMLIGGVIGDAFWRNVRRPVDGVEPARVAAEQSPAGVEAPDSRPLTGDGTAVARESRTAPTASDAPETAPPATGEAPAVSEGASEKDAKALKVEITSSRVLAPSASKRSEAESPAAPPRVKLQPSARDAGNRSAAEARAARQDVAPRRRSPGAQSRVVTSSPRDQSLPVFSPPPDKPGKRAVIQWP